MSNDARIARARLALDGLSIGDAFGETNIARIGPVIDRVGQRAISSRRPWRWTDDTAMALSIVETLDAHGAIDRDDLARRFASRYDGDPARGYGAGAHRVLAAIFEGTPWQLAARALFGGAGSLGNGGGMRAAPIGAYFCDDLERAAREAALSAEPTHAHAEGQAGARGIAVAAAAACSPACAIRRRS
jgi:ADP-ribosylglycohydrolase